MKWSWGFRDWLIACPAESMVGSVWHHFGCYYYYQTKNHLASHHMVDQEQLDKLQLQLNWLWQEGISYFSRSIFSLIVFEVVLQLLKWGAAGPFSVSAWLVFRWILNWNNPILRWSLSLRRSQAFTYFLISPSPASKTGISRGARPSY